MKYLNPFHIFEITPELLENDAAGEIKKLRQRLLAEFELQETSTLTLKEKELDKDIFCKVRSTGKLLEAKVNVNKDLTGEVSLKIPEDGISPGQACVFYAKDQVGYKVLGGGWIQE